MEIHLHGQYTEQDLRRGLALMRGRQFTIMGVVFGLMTAIALLYTIMTVTAEKMEPAALIGNVLPLLILLSIFCGLFWLVPRSQLRQVRNAPLFQGTVSGVATDEALELRSEQSEGKTKWGAFVQYKMSDEVVLLYQNKAAASIVPRSLFATDEDWRQFQQHVRATMPKQGKAQGGILRWRWIIAAYIVLVILGAVLSVLLGGR